jgi:hypothetical protein
MSISDIITLVALILAIIAILSEKNRQHVLLKFYVVGYVYFIVAFALINYFVFYDSFYSRGIFIRQLYFDGFGLNNPKYYAYLLTLALLAYLFFKIWFSFYPYPNLQKVVNFYRVQIEQHEIGLLLGLLEKYHLSDITKMISKSKDYDPKANWRDFERQSFRKKMKNAWMTLMRFLFPFSQINRNIYAVYVLHNILNDPAFTVLAANQRPYFFAAIFEHFRKSKRDAFPRDMMKVYITEWINQKNFWLQKELRESQNHDSGQPEWFFTQNKIIASMISNLDVADVNEVWQPFGQLAKEELEEERLRGYDSKLFLKFREEHHLWEFKTYFAIEFFYILVIEAIRRKYTESHFFLHYYWYIVNDIVETLEEYPPKGQDTRTVYDEFIDKIVGKTFHWLELCNRYDHPSLYLDVLNCLGSIIAILCRSEVIAKDTKTDIIERLLGRYCRLENGAQTNSIRQKIGEILLKPSMTTQAADEYYKLIGIAWDEFDKIPFRQGSHETAAFSQLKQTVIQPLGLAPDKY